MNIYNFNTIHQAQRIKKGTLEYENQLVDNKQLCIKIFVYGIITLSISLLYYFNNTYLKKTPQSFTVTNMETYTGHSKHSCYNVYKLKLKNQHHEINWYVDSEYYYSIKKNETIIIRVSPQQLNHSIIQEIIILLMVLSFCIGIAFTPYAIIALIYYYVFYDMSANTIVITGISILVLLYIITLILTYYY